MFVAELRIKPLPTSKWVALDQILSKQLYYLAIIGFVFAKYRWLLALLMCGHSHNWYRCGTLLVFPCVLADCESSIWIHLIIIKRLLMPWWNYGDKFWVFCLLINILDYSVICSEFLGNIKLQINSDCLFF